MRTPSLNWALIKTTLKIDMHYRFRVFIWMSSGIIWIVVYPAIWLAVYGPRETLGGLSRVQLLTYFIGVLVMEYATQSYVDEDLHEQIRDGRVSSILLKPVDFTRYFFFLHSGFRVLPLLIYTILCAVVITVFHFPFTLPQHLYTIPLLFLSILFGNLIAFNLKMIVSCAAFWLEEAHPVRVVYWIMSNVFMGWVGPLVLFPHWFQILSALLPWQYTLYTPVMIYMEVFDMHATLQSLLGAAIWLVIVTIARRIVLAKSLRHFNAVGH